MKKLSLGATETNWHGWLQAMAEEKPGISEGKSVLVEEHIMGKMKFNVADKIIGNNRKADYWDKKGMVIGYNRATGEYQIRLENGEVHYVSPRWFDKFH